MRVIRWKNSATGVESLNITATGIYFPVGKEDGAFVARYVMAAGGQTASIEDVRSPAGDRVGNPSISVSGTTEVIARNRRSLAYGIAVTAISGTLTATLDDLVVRTNWPDNLGRFTAKGDADAYTYGGTGLEGCGATIAGVPSVYRGPGVGWVAQSGAALPIYATYANLPSLANNGDIAYIPQLVGNELVQMRYVATSARWAVEVGQSVINAYNQFEVVSAPSTAGIMYAFPWVAGLFQPNQTWRVDLMASGVIGAVGGGLRTTFGGTGANSAKTPLSSAIPRVRSNKSFSIKPDGNLDFFEWDGANYTPTFDATMNEGGIPQVGFEPGQAGDSFMLRTYILRRIG